MLCYLPIAQPLIPAQNHTHPISGPFLLHIEFHHTWVFQRSRTHQKDWILGNGIAHSIHSHLQGFLILKIALCLISSIIHMCVCVCVCVCIHTHIYSYMHFRWNVGQNTKRIAEMQYRNIKRTEAKSGTWENSKQQNKRMERESERYSVNIQTE